MRNSKIKPSLLRYLLLPVVFAITAPAQGSISVDCEALAAHAGQEAGIPKHLLPAIARAESGKSQGKLGVRAWPWTLNEEGKGHYFRTREQALAHLKAALKRGVTNIDIGCMQINYRWHSDQFSSVEQMLDPISNTKYAARFLSNLRKNAKDWMTAATHYHSKTPRHANRYRKVLKKIIAKEPGQITIAQAQLADGVIQSGPTDKSGYNTSAPRRLAFADVAGFGFSGKAKAIYETSLVPRGTIDMELFVTPKAISSNKTPNSMRHHRAKVEYFRDDFAKQ